MQICKTCGSVVQPGNSFCSVCGQGLFAPEEALICGSCQTANAPGTRFCKTCGAVLLRKPKTAQCTVCGSENSQDALYCTVCGSEMPGEFEKEFEVESVDKLQKVLPLLQAHGNSIANEYAALSKQEIADTTYVCPVCGKRNNISDVKCRRCGRDKNRSAELAMKQRIPSFEDAVEIPDRTHVPPMAQNFAPVVSDKRPEFINGKRSADSTFAGGGFAGGGFVGGYNGGQSAPIVQPLAIVPYVTQEQPLWQTASKTDFEDYKRQKGFNNPPSKK